MFNFYLGVKMSIKFGRKTNAFFDINFLSALLFLQGIDLKASSYNVNETND